MNVNNSKLDPRFTNWIVKNLKKSEIISLIIVALGLILKSVSLPAGNILVTITLSFLAVLYFFIGYHDFRFSSKMESFLHKLLSYGWAISIIGILFIIQGWPGYEPMLTVGPFPLAVILIIIIYQRSKNAEEYSIIDSKVLLRTFVIVAVALSLRFTPKEMLIKNRIISAPVEVPQQ